MNLMKLSALELGKKIQSGEVSVMEAVCDAMEVINAKEEALHCFITVDEPYAKKRAEQVQNSIKNGELKSLLAGVPMAVKDNLCTKGMRTTCGSKMLEHFIPSYTAEAVQKLEQAGAVLLGKTNMDEFAMGSTSETSYFGGTKNPWNQNHVAGGSSGGSCAAVAANECCYALGSDTGGSIRLPGAFCGVTGIKPTYGTVSRYGLVAYASSMDQVGPVAKDVSDCAAVLEIISSFDKKDSTSIQRPALDFTSALIDNVEGMKIGIPISCFDSELDSEVHNAVLTAAERLKERGAIVREFDLGLMDYAVPAYYMIACAEAGSNLARFDGVKYGYRTEAYEGLHQMYKKSRSEGFGTEVKRRLLLGAFVLSEGYYEDYYLKALRTKACIQNEFKRVFSQFDVLLSPASFSVAPKADSSLDNPLKMYQSDQYTVSANLTGLPAMCLPAGTNQNGLPIGLQLIGNRFEEKKMIRTAYTLEQAMRRKGEKNHVKTV